MINRSGPNVPDLNKNSDILENVGPVNWMEICIMRQCVSSRKYTHTDSHPKFEYNQNYFPLNFITKSILPLKTMRHIIIHNHNHIFCPLLICGVSSLFSRPSSYRICRNCCCCCCCLPHHLYSYLFGGSFLQFLRNIYPYITRSPALIYMYIRNVYCRDTSSATLDRKSRVKTPLIRKHCDRNSRWKIYINLYVCKIGKDINCGFMCVRKKHIHRHIVAFALSFSRAPCPFSLSLSCIASVEIEIKY